MSIGFIGLGQMGAKMVQNLVKNGRKVVAYDLAPAAMQVARDSGAMAAGSLGEVARGCEVIVTMLPSTPNVESAFKGPEGLLANRRTCEGGLFIDCSTIDPVASKALHGEVKAAGGRMLDAPVSGGTAGAEKGTLTFMVGGDDKVIAEATPLLLDMGSTVVHCGGGSTGHAAKLCNNLALGVQMAGVAEAMLLGKHLGIEPDVLAGVINASTGRCWSSEVSNPCPGSGIPTAPSSRGYTGGFAAGLMEKDLFLAAQAARASDSPIPMAAAAHALYSVMKAHNLGHLDFSAVYLLLQGTRDLEI